MRRRAGTGGGARCDDRRGRSTSRGSTRPFPRTERVGGRERRREARAGGRARAGPGEAAAALDVRDAGSDGGAPLRVSAPAPLVCPPILSAPAPLTTIPFIFSDRAGQGAGGGGRRQALHGQTSSDRDEDDLDLVSPRRRRIRRPVGHAVNLYFFPSLIHLALSFACRSIFGSGRTGQLGEEVKWRAGERPALPIVGTFS